MTAERSFDLSGGRLAFDFANTTRYSPPPREDLPTYHDLLAWSVAAGALEEADADALRRQVARRPAEGEAVLERGRELRQAIYRTFSAIASDQPPPAGALSSLSRWVAEAGAKHELVFRDGAFARELPRRPLDPDRMLWVVAADAGELLVSDRLGQVRECEQGTCAWLFLDRSRNRSRRWCDMKTCGNRVKARRHYARVKHRT
jgi:predicted RNA-binding Zn ribbon-like protein